MNTLQSQSNTLTVSPSLLCQLMLAAMEGVATMPDESEARLNEDVLRFLDFWTRLNPDNQTRDWALNELRRADGNNSG